MSALQSLEPSPDLVPRGVWCSVLLSILAEEGGQAQKPRGGLPKIRAFDSNVKFEFMSVSFMSSCEKVASPLSCCSKEHTKWREIFGRGTMNNYYWRLKNIVQFLLLMAKGE